MKVHSFSFAFVAGKQSEARILNNRKRAKQQLSSQVLLDMASFTSIGIVNEVKLRNICYLRMLAKLMYGVYTRMYRLLYTTLSIIYLRVYLLFPYCMQRKVFECTMQEKNSKTDTPFHIASFI